MENIEFNPLLVLIPEDLKYLHVHSTRDALKRSCNLTGQCHVVKHDNQTYANVPTIFYEYVENVDSQKYDESTSSIEIHDSLKIKETQTIDGEEVLVDTGKGWIMHVLATDLALFSFEKGMTPTNETIGKIYDFTSYVTETQEQLATGKVQIVGINEATEESIAKVIENSVPGFVGNTYIVKTLVAEAEVHYPLYFTNGKATGMEVTLAAEE